MRRMPFNTRHDTGGTAQKTRTDDGDLTRQVIDACFGSGASTLKADAPTFTRHAPALSGEEAKLCPETPYRCRLKVRPGTLARIRLLAEFKATDEFRLSPLGSETALITRTIRPRLASPK